MTVKKYDENAAAKLASMMEDGSAYYASAENGVVFCDESGTWAKFIRGYQILSAVWDNDRHHKENLAKIFKNAMKEDSKLADESVSGKLGRKKVRQFRTKDGVEVYAQEKFLRLFPKNTMFYISSPVRPIICGIWEHGQLFPIGLVMPIFRRNGMDFDVA